MLLKVVWLLVVWLSIRPESECYQVHTWLLFMATYPVSASPGIWEDFYLGLHAKTWILIRVFITLYYNGFFSLPLAWNRHREQWFSRHLAWCLQRIGYQMTFVQWLNDSINELVSDSQVLPRARFSATRTTFLISRGQRFPNHTRFHSTLWVPNVLWLYPLALIWSVPGS